MKQEQELKRAVVYLRVSTAQQAKRDGSPEGYSIPFQRDACRRKAESLGALVVDEYVDIGESGTSAERPALQAMLARVQEERDVDIVIVHKVDRLARSREDDLMISLALKTAKVDLVSVTENIDDTPPGRLLHGIMAAIADFYSRNLATEILKGSTQKAKAGGTPTYAPIGYLNVRQVIDGKEVRTIAVDPERAPLVRWAFKAYASGSYTLTQLREELTDRGLETRPGPKRAAKPVSLSKLATMLHNRYYLGKVSYRGVEYEGKHEPLITPELFERVQQVFRAHDVAGERTRRHPHYLKGTVVCARCSSRLSITNSAGNGGVYPYLFCLGRQRKNGCDLPYLDVNKVETWVTEAYAEVQISWEFVEQIRAELRAALREDRAARAGEVKRQKARLTRLENERDKLLRAHYADAVPLEQLKREQKRISREIEEANRVLSTRDLDDARLEETVRQALELAADCYKAYREADDERRRIFNQLFFSKVRLEKDGIAELEISDDMAPLLVAHTPEGNLSRIYERAKSPAYASSGSSKNLLVELRGFEPLTSCLPSKRSTN